ncbi:hypothetical protein AALB64_15470 [Lachnospiraceae bacterium 45-P1]
MRISLQTEEEQKELKDIVRCLNNIANIPKGSIPLMRGMGLGWESLSEVPEDMESEYTVEAAEQFARYEPRIQVQEIQFEHKTDGTSLAAVIFAEGDEVE